MAMRMTVYGWRVTDVADRDGYFYTKDSAGQWWLEYPGDDAIRVRSPAWHRAKMVVLVVGIPLLIVVAAKLYIAGSL